MKHFGTRHYKQIFTIFYGKNRSRSLTTNVYNIKSNYINKLGVFSAVLLGYTTYKYFNKPYVLNDSSITKPIIAKERKDLPYYTFEEVTKHATKDTRIWVTFQKGIYDITDFISEHPGGEQILMAAGNAVDPFWNLYSIHLNPHVYEILEQYRIGNLSDADLNDFTKDLTDPYAADPKRHPCLKIASPKPFNAETPESLLIGNFYTPNELFYVRNHLPVPQIDPEDYVLEVSIEGGKSLTFSLNDIKELQKSSINATIMCAGNRRSDMMKVKAVKGLNWGPCAVGNAKWTGVKLRDVLKMAGIDDENYGEFKHVHFEAYDSDVTNTSYAASIPLWKAVDKRGDVLLAYEMNNEEIPRDHGFPVRVVVPGVVGARNVKWVGRIVVSKVESDSHWQQSDYKGFSPSVDWDNLDYKKSPAIQELPVISAICQTQIIDDYILVKGYAWSGGGQKIVRVDVGLDGGKEWYVADFDHQDSAEAPQHWSWTLWSCKVPVPDQGKSVEVCVKAVDSAYNTQPERFENIWNVRGVLNNAYHRVTVNLK